MSARPQHVTTPPTTAARRSIRPHPGADVTARMDDLASRAVEAAGQGDPAVAWITERQHAIVTASQARTCGLGPDAVVGRRQRGLWRSLHRGIYLVGPQPVSPKGRVFAAVASCAPFAAASHRASAWLYRAIDRPPEVIDVTVLDGHNPGLRDGVEIHRPRQPPARVRWLHGIPVVEPAEALLGLAPQCSLDQLEAIWALLIRNGAASKPALRAAVASSRPRPGLSKLREITAPQVTRSPPERDLLGLIRAAQLLRPETNEDLGGKEVDFWWPDQRLVVEVDAFGTHGDSQQFEADRRLDARLAAQGILVLRFTRRRIREEPFAVIAELAVALALRS